MEIILGSNNKNKLGEMEKILSPFGHTLISQSEAGISLDVEETGTTFEENAFLKAKAIYDMTKKPVIADDSGLEVEALNNAPGVFSHRYAGENATDADRCRKILDEMKNVPLDKRTARFVCVICYIDEKGTVSYSRGECHGIIGYEPKGQNGFGYDPIFMVGEKSFAEISPEEKNKISHRSAALNKFIKLITDLNQ